MDSENEFVDVCGEGDEENMEKENIGGTLLTTLKPKHPTSPTSERKMTFGQRNQGAKEIPFGGQSCLSTPKELLALQPSCSFEPTAQNLKTEEEEEEAEESEDDEEEGGGGRGEGQTLEGMDNGGGEGGGKHRRSITAPRKEKSLGKLCNRFLIRMGEESRNGQDIHLESVARKMNVEKRRIYDIVNVMEALEAMSKTNKSFYRWHGLGQLPKLIHALQSEAKQSILPQKVDEVAKKMCTFVELSQSIFEEKKENGGQTGVKSRQEQSESNAKGDGNCSGTPSAFEDGIANRDRCGKNSLAQLCRRFLMVLLCKESRKVSLDVASTVLIKSSDKDAFEPPPRSKCRRLYDIANVLVAMRLILKKHALFGTKKIPLFEYCGPEPDANPASGHVRMLEFLQRSGLTGIAAEAQPKTEGKAVDVAQIKRMKEEADEGEEMEGKNERAQQKENVNRKRKREAETTVKGANEAKCAKRMLKAQKDEQEQLPRPKPMIPQQQMGFGVLPVPLPATGVVHLQPVPSDFFCPPPRPQQPPPFWPSMALISSLITNPAPHHSHHHPLHHHLPLPPPYHHHPLHFPTVHHPLPPVSSSSSSCSTTKCQNSLPSSKVRHSVQSILGVSQKENIAANKDTKQPMDLKNNPIASSKAFKPIVLQQRQNLHNF